ncbi:DUF2911 domain-containing protein [Pararcticibacter amylolyticus]|uniref:DUF2911 domain-containing protein n=1 Tax=Pararcticibacter amylolyticus TaxID=2173175 RepID=A0A2U2PJD9_9SPHI|nr:DUF2911 domain-containing protein [Pararcticibacter amylolyticus]PWG81528.1 hypothetical protein DDR33_06770 [Pararcticibacter amylolyticus]
MKSLRKILTIAVVSLVFAAPGFAQGIKTPAPSPTQSISQDFALSNISVSYSRPAMKGRTIFGDLVPYGEVWRTGANSPTKIKFGEDVTVNGKAVSAGEYALYSIPGNDQWTFILSKKLTLWGSIGYSEADDLVRFTAVPQHLPFDIENFTILFANQTANSIDVQLLWANVMVGFNVKADIDQKILASIETAMQGEKKPYFQAASWYYEKGLDLDKALSWVNEAVKAQPDAYYIEHLKAKIQLKKGDKKGAIASANSSMKKAEAQKNPDYVALNKKLIAEAGK